MEENICEISSILLDKVPKCNYSSFQSQANCPSHKQCEGLFFQ